MASLEAILHTRYGDISGRCWYDIERSARKRCIPFNITQEYAWELFLLQNKRCVYTNIPLLFSRDYSKNTASLDRINSLLGYECDNVQWVHKSINMAKGAMSHIDFIMLCKQVSNSLGPDESL